MADESGGSPAQLFSTPTLIGGRTPPKLPAPGKTFDPSTVEKDRASQGPSVMTLVNPAFGTFSTLASSRLANVAIANGLGNERPTHCFLSFSEDNQYCFIMPCHETTGALGIKYDGENNATINLWKPFSQFDKKAPKGKREYYAVEFTDEPVTFPEVKKTGFALWMHLVPFEEKVIKPRKKSSDGSK